MTVELLTLIASWITPVILGFYGIYVVAKDRASLKRRLKENEALLSELKRVQIPSTLFAEQELAKQLDRLARLIEETYQLHSSLIQDLVAGLQRGERPDESGRGEIQQAIRDLVMQWQLFLSHERYQSEETRAILFKISELLQETRAGLPNPNAQIKALEESSEGKDKEAKMDPQVLANWIASATFTLQAADLWLNVRSRAEAKREMAKKSDFLQFLPSAQSLANLLPEATLERLVSRTMRCFEDYDATLDDESFSEQEIDRASEAVKACVCRWLRRLMSTNGSLPNGTLQDLWNRYGCQPQP